ncbi:MAG: hypothetical protein U1A77_17230 [Pirellulales bacterium]
MARRGLKMMVVALALGAQPAQAGPIIDWFKSWCPTSKPPCGPAGCGTATCGPAGCYIPSAGQYYPGVPNAPAVVPGAVIPGTAPPGFIQPGTTIPGTVPPGAAFPPRTTNYPPTVSRAVYYPATTPTATVAYPVASAGVVAPAAPAAQVAYYAPAGSVAVACPTCPRPVAAGPTTVNYAPYTTYRNAWARVPVTLYRPVTAIDPVTGRPVTVVQPCVVNTWQVQRVPVGGQPFLSRYQPLPVSGAAPAAVVVSPGAVPSATVCPQGICTPGATTTVWPSNVAPGTTMPTTVMPSAPPPGYPQGSTTLPGTSLGPTAPPPTSQPPSFLGQPARVPPGGAPADQRPVLGPGEGGTLNYPPETDPYRSPPPYVPPAPNENSNTSGGGMLRLPSPPPEGRAAGVPGTSTFSNSSSESRLGAPVPTIERKPAQRPTLKVTPLPDLEPAPAAAPRSTPEPATPRLIVPRERTAALRGTHPTHHVVPAAGEQPINGARSVAKPVVWDESGWRSSATRASGY